jgi:hypothetical protein
MITYFQKFFSILILIFCSFLVLNGNIVSAQNSNEVKNWNLSNSEVQISSPISSQIESDQTFYLRYIQNIKSFESTSKITWQIKNQKSELVYNRSTDSNQDKNEVIKISEPGKYNLNLNLKIGSDDVSIVKSFEIIPKDANYYQGLILNEINFNQSKVELYNKSNKDIDTSALFLDYNSASGHRSIEEAQVIPAQSYAVFDLKPTLEVGKVSLVFEKNLKQKSVENVSYFDNLDLLSYPQSTQPDFSLQFNETSQKWDWAKATFGQKNNFEPETKLNNFTTANFQQIETNRTGGQDFNPFVFISIIILLTAFIFSQFDTEIFENFSWFDKKTITNFTNQKLLELNTIKSIELAKIQASWNNFKTELEFHFWNNLILLKNL